VRRAAYVAVVAVACTACVSSSRSDLDYRLKAANSAAAVLSSVNTAVLGARLAAEGKAPGPYVSVVLAEAEDDALSVQGQFDSVQPPSAAADDVRAELDELFAAAADILADLRIAARRGQLGRLDDIAQPLRAVADDLAGFEQRYGKGP
jgi:hypothetical protein